MYYDNAHVEIAKSARRHGLRDEDILHAVALLQVVVDVEADSRRPKVLVIGPDRAGNLLELIAVELTGERLLVFHVMPLRPIHHYLLAGGETSDG